MNVTVCVCVREREKERVLVELGRVDKTLIFCSLQEVAVAARRNYFTVVFFLVLLCLGYFVLEFEHVSHSFGSVHYLDGWLAPVLVPVGFL